MPEGTRYGGKPKRQHGKSQIHRRTVPANASNHLTEHRLLFGKVYEVFFRILVELPDARFAAEFDLLLLVHEPVWVTHRAQLVA
jgi:hypothetical protein